MKKENLATSQMAGLYSLEQYLLAIFQGYSEHGQLGPEQQRLASQSRNLAASALVGQWLATCELQAVQLHLLAAWLAGLASWSMLWVLLRLEAG